MTRCHGKQEHMRVTFDVLCRQHHVWLPVCVCVCVRARAPERARACWTCVCGCVRACVYVCVCIVRTHVCVHTCAHIIHITSVDKHTHTERETHTHTDTHTPGGILCSNDLLQVDVEEVKHEENVSAVLGVYLMQRHHVLVRLRRHLLHARVRA